MAKVALRTSAGSLRSKGGAFGGTTAGVVGGVMIRSSRATAATSARRASAVQAHSANSRPKLMSVRRCMRPILQS